MLDTEKETNVAAAAAAAAAAAGVLHLRSHRVQLYGGHVLGKEGGFQAPQLKRDEKNGFATIVAPHREEQHNIFFICSTHFCLSPDDKDVLLPLAGLRTTPATATATTTATTTATFTPAPLLSLVQRSIEQGQRPQKVRGGNAA